MLLLYKRKIDDFVSIYYYISMNITKHKDCPKAEDTIDIDILELF